MKSTRSKALTSACLMATALTSSGCGGAADLHIPDSLKAPCESTFDATGATTLGDISNGIVIGDADLRVCSIQKDAVVAIAESRNRRWWQF